jgi:uncharacterized membrane protein YhaH (DUF805 family)
MHLKPAETKGVNYVLMLISPKIILHVEVVVALLLQESSASTSKQNAPTAKKHTWQTVKTTVLFLLLHLFPNTCLVQLKSTSTTKRSWTL